MYKRIKIIQIGICHEHASGKMAALKLLPELYEIVGLVDDSTIFNGKRFMNWHPRQADGVKSLSLSQVWDYPDLEAVMVEVPNSDLVSVALQCMEHNLAMHMDKPAGEDLVLFRKLISGCKQRQLPFQMGFMFRTNPAFRFALHAIHAGWLGDIFEIEADMNHCYGGELYQEYLGNFRGGIMYNLGCHLIDFTVSAMGLPDRVIPVLKSVAGYPDLIKNNTVVIFDYPHATVTIRACSFEALGSGSRRMKIAGTKGTLEFSPLEQFAPARMDIHMTLKEGNDQYETGTHVVECDLIRNRHVDQLIELAGIIRGKIQNPDNYEHDYNVAELTLAASGFPTRYNI